MDFLFRGRLPWVWLALSAMTLFSLWVSAARPATHGPNLAISMAVILFAMIKTRFVLRDFMEISHAARWLRYGADLWVVLLPLAIYFASTR